LDDGLHDHLAVREVLQVGGVAQTGQGSVPVLCGELAAVHCLGQGLLDSRLAGVDGLLLQLPHEDVRARLRSNLCDSSSHESCSDDAYSLHHVKPPFCRSIVIFSSIVTQATFRRLFPLSAATPLASFPPPFRHAVDRMFGVNIDGQEVTAQRIDSVIDGLIDVRFHWEATTERVNRLREGGPAPTLCSEASARLFGFGQNLSTAAFLRSIAPAQAPSIPWNELTSSLQTVGAIPSRDELEEQRPELKKLAEYRGL